MIKNVDKMQRCGWLVYAGHAKARVATTRLNKTEDTPMRTAAGEAPSTEWPLHTTLPQNTHQPNPQTQRRTPLLLHKAAVEQVDSLGQQRPFPSAVVGALR